MDPMEFLDRVMKHLPRGAPSSYHFECWRHGDKPTSEGVGLLPVPDVDPGKLIAHILDVDHYVGNVDHVLEARVIKDPQLVPPKGVHLYEKIHVPLVSKIQMELALVDRGEVNGFRVLTWHQLDQETARLNPKDAARSDYNVGAWLVKPGQVGYALASAPRREDVGLLKFKALTSGADALAPKVMRANIECVAAWARRR
jgi:hypothetical protein